MCKDDSTLLDFNPKRQDTKANIHMKRGHKYQLKNLVSVSKAS